MVTEEAQVERVEHSVTSEPEQTAGITSSAHHSTSRQRTVGQYQLTVSLPPEALINALQVICSYSEAYKKPLIQLWPF